MTGTRKEIQILGYLGLIPFVVLGVWPWIFAGQSDWVARALALYAFGILCFLLGSWWGIALLRNDANVSILSNLVFLVAAAGAVLLPPPVWFLLAAFLFLLLLVMERRLMIFNRQPVYYAKLRLHLSLAASASLLCNYWASSWG